MRRLKQIAITIRKHDETPSKKRNSYIVNGPHLTRYLISKNQVLMLTYLK
jgi:hypothetical protein